MNELRHSMNLLFALLVDFENALADRMITLLADSSRDKPKFDKFCRDPEAWAKNH